MSNHRLIIVSNRLPISVTKTEDGLLFADSSGGLATAMSSLRHDGEKLWIGWPGIASDDLTSSDKRAISRYLKARGCLPVYLTKAEVEGFYEGYSNDTLWPLFHYFTSLVQYQDEYYRAYVATNKRYLQVVRGELSVDDTLWIHDYHLMLLPQMVRTIQPSASIGFFLHIPFPSFEIFRSLPQRQAILSGILGADLVGFHVYDYARHFLSSTLRLLGTSSTHGRLQYGERVVAVDAFPIGIDYDKFAHSVATPPVMAAAELLRSRYGTQKILMSVDRLDYSKGIPVRLEAFDVFLRTYPKWHGNVSMVMIAVPSRTEVDAYQSLRETIEKAVSRINGTYGTIDWTPISYQFRNLEFTDIAALYSETDVALVTPLRDGMNLVAKEYVACKQGRPGVLILSEMAGAIDELPEALAVNPHDVVSIAEAIHQALTMPRKQQMARLASMQNRLSRYTVERWGQDFLDQLQMVKQLQIDGPVKQMTIAQKNDIIVQLKRAKKRLILLDYDGTLRGFVSSHRLNDAKPSKQLLALLEDLTALPHTSVYIVSGRDKQTLESWFGHIPLGLVAEHGAYCKLNGAWEVASESFDEYKQHLQPLFERYVDRTAGALLEVKNYSLVWHYRDVSSELAYSRTANLRHDLELAIQGTNLSVYAGNKTLELKLTSITKGAVAKQLLAQTAADFVMAIGDDRTDEDMFVNLPSSAVTVNVGQDTTSARYQVLDVDDVVSFLEDVRRAA